MKFVMAVAVYLLISLVLGVGIWLATAKGNWWLFWLSLLGFLGGLSKCCLPK